MYLKVQQKSLIYKLFIEMITGKCKILPLVTDFKLIVEALNFRGFY